MVHINQGIYVGNYLEDGLTFNRRIHNLKSPIGCMFRAKEFMCTSIKLKYRIRGTVQYHVYWLFAKYSIARLIKETPCPSLSIMLLVPSLLLYQKWKKNIDLF